MEKVEKIVLEEMDYATPKTESVKIENQGVLCASSSMGGKGLKLGSGSTFGW